MSDLNIRVRRCADVIGHLQQTQHCVCGDEQVRVDELAQALEWLHVGLIQIALQTYELVLAHRSGSSCIRRRRRELLEPIYDGIQPRYKPARYHGR